MTRTLTPRGQDRRRQLMAYAADRFAANGYHPTSVAEIVQGIGVGKGVFYWHFRSRGIAKVHPLWRPVKTPGGAVPPCSPT